jgi:membrane-associated HD superfamily phosphohydrolase
VAIGYISRQRLCGWIKRKLPARQRQVPAGEKQPDLSRKIYPVCCRLFIKNKELFAVSKSDPASAKKERNKTIRWVVTIFFVTIFVSGTISLISDQIMSVSGTAVAFLILLAIILIGIIFDVIGVAVTSADEKPFHSMAARKVPGATDAIKLLRNAERVSSICCDVIGDICGVVSGSASATIAAQILSNFEFSWPQIISLIMSALVAGLTVGGKAVGKTFAMNSSTVIVHTVGKISYNWEHMGRFFPKKKK